MTHHGDELERHGRFAFRRPHPFSKTPWTIADNSLRKRIAILRRERRLTSAIAGGRPIRVRPPVRRCGEDRQAEILKDDHHDLLLAS